jgi:hypothetical protein
MGLIFIYPGKHIEIHKYTLRETRKVWILKQLSEYPSANHVVLKG